MEYSTALCLGQCKKAIAIARRGGSRTAPTTSATGAIFASVKYYPFGECRNSQGTLDTDKLFTGQHLDDTGLYYYNARYYDATIGRFISPDTYVQDPTNPQMLNRYSYCNNNPLKYTDPSGHCGLYTNLTYPYQTDDEIQEDLNRMIDKLDNWKSCFDLSDYSIGDFCGDVFDMLGGHEILDAVGMIPGLGEGFDFINGLIYSAEGDSVNAGLSFAACVPFVGWAATGGKYIYKGVKWGDNVLGLTKFTKNNYREGLIRATGIDPGTAAQAHHVFPQKYADKILNKQGINIHEPQYLTWWETASHQDNWRSYNAAWDKFMAVDRTPSEILDFGWKTMAEYNMPVRY